MRQVMPGGKLLRDIDDVGARMAPGEHERIDFAPLASRVESEALFLEPEVVSGIQRAEVSLGDGKRDEAFESLRNARERLFVDTATPLLDDAFRRLAASETALKKGDLSQAATLLSEAQPTLREVALRAPLVSVRFDLRAAAASADLGEWDRALRFVARATTRLEQLQQMSDAPEIPALLREAQRLETALRSRSRPQASAIRWLAGRTRLASSG
jgi:hypothetical protein